MTAENEYYCYFCPKHGTEVAGWGDVPENLTEDNFCERCNLEEGDEPVLGFCTECFCVRWLADVMETSPFHKGTCRTCKREADNA